MVNSSYADKQPVTQQGHNNLSALLEQELQTALDNNELVLHYQPKVNLTTGRITSAEALIRWQHPERGLIPPAQFIPLAEKSGLIEPISNWVLTTACAQTKIWHETEFIPLTIAVNISGHHFKGTCLPIVVQNILQETGLDPQHLELEITESALIHDLEHAVSLLQLLKQYGVIISLDDFGTGYSSLSYLKRFPVDKLKLDYSFVRDITNDTDSASIARAVLAMAHSLNLTVIAEGVETRGQLEYLRRQGYDEIQGYYVSKPISVDAFTCLLKQRGKLEFFSMPDQSKPSNEILVVDDESNIIKALTRFFEMYGFSVVPAYSAAEALELLALREIPVILTDNRMPGMDGCELVRLAKELHPLTVRIMMTGYSDLDTVISAINDGAVFKFVTKPWDDAKLHATIVEAFRYHRFLQETTIMTSGCR